MHEGVNLGAQMLPLRALGGRRASKISASNGLRAAHNNQLALEPASYACPVNSIEPLCGGSPDLIRSRNSSKRCKRYGYRCESIEKPSPGSAIGETNKPFLRFVPRVPEERSPLAYRWRD